MTVSLFSRPNSVIANRQKLVSLYSDFLSSISSLKTGQSITNNNLVLEIFSIINSSTATVEIVWVLIAMHIGIQGNEETDVLASHFTQRSSIDTGLQLEVEESHHKIR